jgi:hypothetical protein
MSCKYQPVHLPIIVEPKCGKYTDNCSFESVSKCTVSCETTNYSTQASQGSYQNSCNKVIANIPRVPFASLSNVRDNDCLPNTAIKLNNICLTWCEFLRLFYPNNTFRISLYDKIPCATSFSGQTYEDTSSPCIRFYLTEWVKRAWESKCNAPFSNIPLKTSILLEKDTNSVKSLYCANSVTSLTIDDIINTMITSGQIEPADSTSSAEVIFTLEYLYYFKPLDVTVQVNFNYKTAIPCYKNIELCNSWCPAYNNCSNCVEPQNNNNNKAYEFLETESTIGGDSNSQSDMDSFSEQLKDLASKHNDNDSVSLDPSKW